MQESVKLAQNILIGAAGAGSIPDHLGIKNCRIPQLPMQVLCLMLQSHRITLTPRQLKRIEDFALGVQLLVLHQLLYRLPLYAGLPEEKKWIIHQCNMRVFSLIPEAVKSHPIPGTQIRRACWSALICTGERGCGPERGNADCRPGR